MGDCDKLKKYISDYLDGTLDPTTRQQFEQGLSSSAELKQLTERIQHTSNMLSKLPKYQCDKSFNVQLRERIHSGNPSSRFNSNIRRYSLAFSFVVIIGITIFGVRDYFSNDTYIQTTPVTNEVSTQEDVLDNTEYDVKTRNPQNAAVDSSSEQVDARIKYVDQKK